MKITDVRTFLMNASPPGRTTWRHWLFVKVHTDEPQDQGALAGRKREGLALVRGRCQPGPLPASDGFSFRRVR